MRILIIEDELLIRQRLLRMAMEIAETRANFTAVANMEDADSKLRARAYDAVLLDLNLEGEDGFILLRRALAGAAHVVVVSAHHERAIEAYELGVIDFVPKPFTRERLSLALQRLFNLARDRPSAMRWLNVWRAKGTAFVALDDMVYARATDSGSELVLSQARTELHDKSLQALSELLPEHFVRCHRRYLVNLNYVVELVSLRGSRYQLKLSNAEILPVGRTQLRELRSRLEH